MPSRRRSRCIVAAIYRRIRKARGREIDHAITVCALARNSGLWTLNLFDVRTFPIFRRPCPESGERSRRYQSGVPTRTVGTVSFAQSELRLRRSGLWRPQGGSGRREPGRDSAAGIVRIVRSSQPRVAVAAAVRTVDRPVIRPGSVQERPFTRRYLEGGVGALAGEGFSPAALRLSSSSFDVVRLTRPPAPILQRAPAPGPRPSSSSRPREDDVGPPDLREISGVVGFASSPDSLIRAGASASRT